MALKDRLYNSVAWNLLPTVTKYSYPWMTSRLAGHDVIPMNNGYEEDPRWGWSWTTPTNPADSPSRRQCLETLFPSSRPMISQAPKLPLEIHRRTGARRCVMCSTS
jgi:hypothetical protein